MQQENLTQPTAVNPIKRNNFLIYLLTGLLIIFILLSGYFTYAYTKAQKEVKILNEQVKKLEKQIEQLHGKISNSSSLHEANLDKSSYKEIKELAMKTGNEKLCDKIPPGKEGHYHGDDCYIYLSKLKDNISLCKKSNVNPSLCDEYFKDKAIALETEEIKYQDSAGLFYSTNEYSFKYPEKNVELKENNWGIYHLYSCYSQLKDLISRAPEDHIFDEGVLLISNEISVRSFTNTEKLSIRLWIQKNEDCGYAVKPYGRDIIIDGTQGVRIEKLGTCPPGGSGVIDRVYLSKGDHIYTISIINFGSSLGGIFEDSEKGIQDCQKDRDQVFNQILSTFKFID